MVTIDTLQVNMQWKCYKDCFNSITQVLSGKGVRLNNGQLITNVLNNNQISIFIFKGLHHAQANHSNEGTQLIAWVLNVKIV